MAAMSIVICSKTAKVIFARQFVPMTRRELEEYVVQFSRGIDSCKDITHFESDKVRYLFIPIDTFFLILITSRTSNIIEDTEILKLIYRLVQDVCGAVDYESITQNAFELMMGVDDIVCLGYRSGANIAQVKQYMQMESLEEKEFKRRKLEQERKVQRDLQIFFPVFPHELPLEQEQPKNTQQCQKDIHDVSSFRLIASDLTAWSVVPAEEAYLPDIPAPDHSPFP